jgi:hypothetical protein
MDELCRRFPWFYRYAKILESVAAGIQSGSLLVAGFQSEKQEFIDRVAISGNETSEGPFERFLGAEHANGMVCGRAKS